MNEKFCLAWSKQHSNSRLLTKCTQMYRLVVKDWGFPYSWPNVGPGPDPNVQAVSPAAGCHYFRKACGYLPSRRASPSLGRYQVTLLGVNNLPKVVTQLLPRVGFEPSTCWSQVQRSTRCGTSPTGNCNVIASPFFMITYWHYCFYLLYLFKMRNVSLELCTNISENGIFALIYLVNSRQ